MCSGTCVIEIVYLKLSLSNRSKSSIFKTFFNKKREPHINSFKKFLNHQFIELLYKNIFTSSIFYGILKSFNIKKMFIFIIHTLNIIFS